ncbi:MAG: ECF transporter S component [Clostridia bacterium]|nr:ECF transporter S component [Clostridia bacterium]
MESKSFFSAKRITGIAVLTALVIVLQTVLGSIRIGATSFSLVLIPIVLGGVIYGAWTGAFLGFVFGFITLMYGIVGADAFTAILFQNQPLETALLCLVKGTAAGLVSGALYKELSKKNELVAVFLAAAAAPIVNTGLFIGGSLLFLQQTLLVNFVESGSTVVYFLFIGCAGFNFLVEFAVNLVAAPTLYRVIRILEKGKRK